MPRESWYNADINLMGGKLMLDQLYKIARLVVVAAILVIVVFWLARLDADVRYLQKDVATLQADVGELQIQVDEVQQNQRLILDLLRGLLDDDPSPQPQPTGLDDWGGGF